MTFIREYSELYKVLKQATREELILLSKIISEKISSEISDACSDPYKIAKELQEMGGNSVANLCRGHGVSYKELAFDAAKKVGAKVKYSNTINEIEWALLETLIKNAEEKMSREDKQKFYKEIEEKGFAKGFTFKDGLIPVLTYSPYSYMLVIKFIFPYILRSLGLETAAIFLGSRALTASVPVIGWGLAAGSVLYTLAGTAYTVTIPCTAYIGGIRARLEAEKATQDITTEEWF
jgi:uncharacterized protein YaaW (UPF0174 family)